MRQLKAAVIPRQPIAGSEAKEVMIRVYVLGMHVVRGPTAATLVPHINNGYDISIF